MKIMQVQNKVYFDKDKTLDNVKRMIENNFSDDIDFIALPEMFACPYDNKYFKEYGEEEGGKVWCFLRNLAIEYGVYLIGGSLPEIEYSPDKTQDSLDKIYNTGYIFDPKGNCIAKHRKKYLFDIDVEGGQRFKESDVLTPGDKATVFDTDICKCGVCICFDYRFPEICREMALKGAKVIFVPASFNMTTGPAHWEIMFRSQSLNNQVFSVGTSPARDEEFSYISYGHSIITDPWGQKVSESDEKQGVIITDIDIDMVDKVRQELPLLTNVIKDKRYDRKCQKTNP